MLSNEHTKKEESGKSSAEEEKIDIHMMRQMIWYWMVRLRKLEHTFKFYIIRQVVEETGARSKQENEVTGTKTLKSPKR